MKSIVAYTLSFSLSFLSMSGSAQNNDGTQQTTASYSDCEPREWVKIEDGTDLEPAAFFRTQAATLGLGPNDEMRLVKEERDEMGFTHSRFQQYHKNVEVAGGEFVVHRNAEGMLYLANGKMVPCLTQSVVPTFTANEAIAKAKAIIGAKRYMWESEFWEKDIKEHLGDPSATYAPDPKLVLARTHNSKEFRAENFELCYELDMHAMEPESSSRLFISARTGQKVNEYPLEATGCTQHSVGTTYYGTQTVNVNNDNAPASYDLDIDCLSNGSMEVRDWNSTTATANPQNITSTTGNWTTTDQEFGVSAVFGLTHALDYASDIHGRNSYDNAGGHLDVYINAVFNSGNGGTTVNNASANANGRIKIGIGDPSFTFPTTCISSDPLEASYTTVDILSHEFWHIVDANAANLTYQGESGALDESFADIFGEMSERHAFSSHDWKIGAERCRGHIRSLSDPNEKNDPDTYNGTHWASTAQNAGDNGGVHTNSGVQNYLFYLLADGGSGTNDNGHAYNITGIGKNAARWLAYRVHTVYLTSSSDYEDARKAWLQAAADGYGSCSTVQQTVASAWQAVGVGAGNWTSVVYVDDIAPNSFIAPGQSQSMNFIWSPLVNPTSHANGAIGQVDFKAVNTIYLKPGFKATAVASNGFTAKLTPCSEF